ncbi:MAG: hypothetical protein U9Q80_05680 [Bacillota bacterium]|nr:hypothetical protein [Bacillota bacterium]
MNKRGEVIVEGVIVITIVLLLCSISIKEIIRIKGLSFRYFQTYTYDYEELINDLVKELRIEKGTADGK